MTALLAAGAAAAPTERVVVVISDLHMGLGSQNGTWHGNEDFRWPKALAGFLKKIDAEEPNPIDLVIAGDFLELWEASFGRCTEAPDAAHARGEDEAPGPDYGCTVAEMEGVADAVLAGHAEEIGALARFAAGGNCVHVLTGNHDAALLLPSVGQRVEASFQLAQPGSCVRRPGDGLFVSEDKRLLVEHGHQVPYDPNGYRDWPNITKKFGDHWFLEQPWGELFVQRLYTKEEVAYPLIDNLSPHSAGVRYRLADRGVWGSVKDVARFVKFNLLETSLKQKVDLGVPKEGELPKWDVAEGRRLKRDLFLGGLPDSDPLRAALLRAPGEPPPDGDWEEVGRELDALAADPERLPDEEVLALCDALALRKAPRICWPPELAVSATASVLASRRHTVQKHVGKRREVWTALSTWVSGHTHSFEIPWSVEPERDIRVEVSNSGAFQRLVDDDRLRAIAAKEGTDPLDLLKEGGYALLPACYTAVRIGPNAPLRARVRAWLMDEAEGGQFVEPCDPRCARVGHGCTP